MPPSNRILEKSFLYLIPGWTLYLSYHLSVPDSPLLVSSSIHRYYGTLNLTAQSWLLNFLLWLWGKQSQMRFLLTKSTLCGLRYTIGEPQFSLVVAQSEWLSEVSPSAWGKSFPSWVEMTSSLCWMKSGRQLSIVFGFWAIVPSSSMDSNPVRKVHDWLLIHQRVCTQYLSFTQCGTYGGSEL